jgi:hypothetical protein
VNFKSYFFFLVVFLADDFLVVDFFFVAMALGHLLSRTTTVSPRNFSVNDFLGSRGIFSKDVCARFSARVVRALAFRARDAGANELRMTFARFARKMEPSKWFTRKVLATWQA